MVAKTTRNENRQVVIVTPRFLPLLGGMERQVALLAEAFSEFGWRVVVVTERLDGSPRREAHGRIEILRVGANRQRLDPLEGRRPLSEQLHSAAELASVLLRYGRHADLVIVRTFTLPAVVVGALKKLHAMSGVSVVTAETGGARDDPTVFASLPGQLLLRGFLRGNDFFNCLVSSNRASIRALGVPESRMTMIPNGIQFDSWQSPPPMPPVRRFLYVGRLSVDKGLRELLEAFASVRHVHPEVRLSLAGSGPDRDELEVFARQLDISDGVEFLGMVDYGDLPTVVRSHDCFVLPSHSEALPLSAIEASAARRFLIVSDVGDLRSIFGASAVIVPPKDSKALSDAMLEVADLAEQPRVNRGLMRFDIGAVARSYSALVRSIP